MWRRDGWGQGGGMGEIYIYWGDCGGGIGGERGEGMG